MFRTQITALTLGLTLLSAAPVLADNVIVFTASNAQEREHVERTVRQRADRQARVGYDRERDLDGLGNYRAETTMHNGGNAAVVSQRGSGNAAGTGQRGNNNLSLIVQNGNGNRSTTSQRGNNNVVGIFNSGSGHATNVRHRGNGNATMIIIEGSCSGPDQTCAFDNR